MDVTSLLLSGARMTAQHCPTCSFPLFEKDGKTFCPNCTKEEKTDGNLFDKKEEELRELLAREREPEKIKPILECLLLLRRLGEHDVPKRT
jgi:UPF0148 protein